MTDTSPMQNLWKYEAEPHTYYGAGGFIVFCEDDDGRRIWFKPNAYGNFRGIGGDQWGHVALHQIRSVAMRVTLKLRERYAGQNTFGTAHSDERETLVRAMCAALNETGFSATDEQEASK